MDRLKTAATWRAQFARIACSLRLRKSQPLLLLALIVTASAPVSASAADAKGERRNVAGGRPYTLSTPPNYPTARTDADTLLTDGVAPDGPYWSNGTTLGWSRLTPLTVSVNLAEATPVSSVEVQAGAKKSGEIYYPSQIFVFGGDGAGRYAFLGATAVQTDGESPNWGALQRFEISFPPRLVQEVVVLAFARGPYVFLGEISAFAASGGTPVAPDLASLDAVRADATQRRREAIAALPAPKPAGQALTRRWAMPLTEVSADPGQAPAGGCEIQRIEPWQDEPGKTAEIAADTPLIGLAGGQDYAAFRIVNRTGAEVKVSVPATGSGQTAPRWFALAHVPALDYSWVPDVMVPFGGGALPLRSAMTLLAEVEAHRAGLARVTFDIACAERTAHFDIAARAIMAPNDIPPLHGNLWTYLHEPQHLPVERALACQPDFLSRFGVDTAVVHPNAVLDDGGSRPAELLAHYFRAYRDASRVLLFMDVKTRPWTFRKMSDSDAAKALQDWWGWVQKVARQEGLKAEIILYPIDEPQPADVPLLLRTRDLFRLANINAKVYATAQQKTAAALQSLDILQLHRPVSSSREGLQVAELQGYDTRRDGKLLSVHRYYRMQGWQAFQLDLAGVGIWSAWDSSGLADPASGWNPFTGAGERDFGLLYLSPDGCGWPSRRLIAWRRGLEENRILRSCAKGEQGGVAAEHARKAIAEGSAQAARRALEQVVEGCKRS